MRVVLMGDSITLGLNASSEDTSWAGRLKYYLGKNFNGPFEIINSGAEGDTASDGFQKIEDIVIKYTPDIVFIGYGTNDCTKINGKYNNDYYNFESNIEDIAKAIKSQTNASIIFNLSPPVIEGLACSDTVVIHNRDISSYNDVVKRVCGSMMIPFIDHFSIMKDKKNFNELIDSDGLHPNDMGHGVMFESIIGCAGHFFR